MDFKYLSPVPDSSSDVPDSPASTALKLDTYMEQGHFLGKPLQAHGSINRAGRCAASIIYSPLMESHPNGDNSRLTLIPMSVEPYQLPHHFRNN